MTREKRTDNMPDDSNLLSFLKPPNSGGLERPKSGVSDRERMADYNELEGEQSGLKTETDEAFSPLPAQ